jgi:hypothetical protein
METKVAITPIGWEWFSQSDGTRPTAIDIATAKSLIRYARQNYDCDMEPRITEFVMLPETNEWGDDVLATVQYSRSGYVSSAGGSLDDNGHITWRCYAD